MSRIGVLIVEDNPGMSEALQELLALQESIDVVGVASDAEHGISLARTLHPTVALVDVRMPGGGPHATREMQKLEPAPAVLAHSVSGDRGAVREMLRAGAVGYLVKGSSGADLAEAIRRAERGEATLSPGVAGDVIELAVENLEASESRAAERAGMLTRLEPVLEGEGISPVFQPVYFLARGQIVGYEALTRFTAEPQRGPLEWFAEADAVGKGVELELATANVALAAIREHRRPDPLAGGYLALNASPATLLADGFGDTLRGGFPASRLVVEITEHAEVANYTEFQEQFAELGGEGVRLAVDDVGAGFASLRHILRLEPEFLKLDLSLTRDIDSDRNRRAMAAALVSFAHQTDTVVIAEGIETEPELEVLREIGVDCGQGYYLARPVPLDQLESIQETAAAA